VLAASSTRSLQRVFARHLLEAAGLEADEGHGGAVALIQRFGSAANLNIHLHGLLLDGLYRCGADGVPQFVEAGSPTDDEVHALLQAIITRLMKMRGLVCPSAMPGSWVRSPSDFSMPRTAASAFERVALTADILDESLRQHRSAPIAIASLPSTTTAAYTAVSSLEACPTPALRLVHIDASPRAGVRQPLTIGFRRLWTLFRRDAAWRVSSVSAAWLARPGDQAACYDVHI
jgi:hypothetical protein